jgi:outer membrane receptor protein involved in Fe transport
LRVFADLERVRLTRNHEWSKGARISLAVINLFDRRQTVRDATGATPAAFEPGFLDPPGRTVALTVRKVF